MMEIEPLDHHQAENLIPTTILCHIFSYIKDRETWEACHLVSRPVHELMKKTCPAPFPDKKPLEMAGVNDMDMTHPNFSTGEPSKLAIAVSFGTVQIWNSQKGKITSLSTNGAADIIQYSPDGRYLAVASEQGGIVSIFVADDENYPLVHEIRSDLQQDMNINPCSIAFSPCSQKIAIGRWDGSISLYNLSTQSSDDAPLCLLEATTPQLSTSGCPARIIFHQTKPQIWCCLTTPKTFYSGRHTIVLWDFQKQKVLKSCFFEDAGDEMKAVTMATSRMGVHFAVSISDSTLIWNLDRKKGLSKPSKTNDIFCPDIDHIAKEKGCHSMKVSSLDISLDGKRIVTASFDNTLRVWDVLSGRCIRILKGHKRVPRIAKFMTPNGSTVASAGLDQTVRFWNI
jgi:WD40 repeat protein